MKNIKTFLFLSLAAVALCTGCAVTRKADTTEHPHKDFCAEFPDGVVVAPPGYQVVPVTNHVAWNLRDFVFGAKARSFELLTDHPRDRYTGSGKFLLADPAFAALHSTHTNQTVLGGASEFSVGNATIAVSTNGITAVGTAGSQLIDSVGNAAGKFINSGVTGK